MMYLLIAIILVGFYAVFLHNRFVAYVARTKEAWSDIDVQLKRRYDLIPNLVNTVKGYAAHETTAFEKVITARSAAMSAQGVADKTKAEGELSGTLKSLFALSENYPDLKANTNFLELQRELSDTENKLQAARRFYNGTVLELNTAVDSFPSNLIAGMFHFAKAEFFTLDEEAAKKPVEVKF
jgi:LemA protein